MLLGLGLDEFSAVILHVADSKNDNQENKPENIAEVCEAVIEVGFDRGNKERVRMNF